jgi:hypothetical protein
MARNRNSVDETSVEPRSKFKQAPNRRRPEAVAMRRIVIENGFWLSPFMRDAPLPVLSEWEKTVDLSRLSDINYCPVDPSDAKPTPEPKKTGANIRLERPTRTLAELRDRQSSMNAKRNAKRRKVG